MLELDGTLIIAIISFIVFAFIMNAVFYQPIMKIMEERQAFLANNDSDAKKAEQEAEKISNQKQNELAEAKAIATKNVSSSSEKLKKEQKIEIEEFTKEQKEKTEKEKNQLLQDAENAKNEIKTDVEDIANIISSKILEGTNV